MTESESLVKSNKLVLLSGGLFRFNKTEFKKFIFSLHPLLDKFDYVYFVFGYWEHQYENFSKNESWISEFLLTNNITPAYYCLTDNAQYLWERVYSSNSQFPHYSSLRGAFIMIHALRESLNCFLDDYKLDTTELYIFRYRMDLIYHHFFQINPPVTPNTIFYPMIEGHQLLPVDNSCVVNDQLYFGHYNIINPLLSVFSSRTLPIYDLIIRSEASHSWFSTQGFKGIEGIFREFCRINSVCCANIFVSYNIESHLSKPSLALKPIFTSNIFLYNLVFSKLLFFFKFLFIIPLRAKLLLRNLIIFVREVFH